MANTQLLAVRHTISVSEKRSRCGALFFPFIYSFWYEESAADHASYSPVLNDRQSVTQQALQRIDRSASERKGLSGCKPKRQRPETTIDFDKILAEGEALNKRLKENYLGLPGQIRSRLPVRRRSIAVSCRPVPVRVPSSITCFIQDLELRSYR